MKKTVALSLGFVACLVALESSVTAGERSEVVQFKSGATSATKSAAITGYDGINYVLGAKAGQAMIDPAQAEQQQLLLQRLRTEERR